MKKLSRKNLTRLQRDFAAGLADPKGNFVISTTSNTTRSRITNYLNNPVTNADSIAQEMNSMIQRNGIIRRVVSYYLSHLTYNHNIYPLLGTNKSYEFDQQSGLEDYIDVANTLDLLNPKFFAPYFVKETLINGVSYFYEISDKKGTAYIEFPFKWCRVTKVENGVYRYRLDMSNIKAEIIEVLPTEIQAAYEDYTNGNMDDTSKWYDNKWYMVSEKGMAFCFDESVIMNGGVAISEFASLLLDAVDLENAKSNVQIKDKIDTVRLVHSKVPSDADGMPAIPLDVTKLYDQQMQARLPEGVISVTSPNNLTNIPLNGAGSSKSYDTVNQATGQVFYDTAVPSAVFGDKTTSSNIAKLSIQNTANWLYTFVLPNLTNFYNYKLSKFKTKNKYRWQIRFFNQSNFSMKDDIALIKDQVTLGGSRTDLLTATGASPAEVYSHLLFEQDVMNIDEVMVVKATSHTVSGAEDAAAGRPKTDNPSDDTDRIEGSE